SGRPADARGFAQGCRASGRGSRRRARRSRHLRRRSDSRAGESDRAPGGRSRGCRPPHPAARVAPALTRDQGFDTVIVDDLLSISTAPLGRSTGNTTPWIVIVPVASAVRFLNAPRSIVIVNGPAGVVTVFVCVTSRLADSGPSPVNVRSRVTLAGPPGPKAIGMSPGPLSLAPGSGAVGPVTPPWMNPSASSNDAPQPSEKPKMSIDVPLPLSNGLTNDPPLTNTCVVAVPVTPPPQSTSASRNAKKEICVFLNEAF